MTNTGGHADASEKRAFFASGLSRQRTGPANGGGKNQSAFARFSASSLIAFTVPLASVSA
jgi:hypothetical protein